MLFLKSPAKINLHLRVLSKRPDGYHEIATIFQAIDLCDEMTLDVAKDGIRMQSHGFPIPEGETNLAYRAAALMMEHYNPGIGVRITIDKRIPVAAGLGGGSSDAATTLFALNKLWGLNLGLEKLREHAAALGSDVPFFLSGPAAAGRGRGEILSSLPPVKGVCLVLVVPNFEITAAFAYSVLNLGLTKKADDISIIQSSIRKGKINHWGPLLSNDLELAIFERYPIIEQIKTELLEKGKARAALMSGSGPAVYGLFDEESSAREAVEAVKGSDRTVIFTKTLDKVKICNNFHGVS